MDFDYLDLNWFASRIRDRTPFSFARYGDGEWMAIMQTGDGRNCDGVALDSALGRDLYKTLKQPFNYVYGLVRIARTALGPEIEAFSREWALPVRWVEGTVFVDASRDGRLAPLVDALRTRRVVYVGPGALLPVSDNVFPVERFVEVHPTEAYDQRMKIIWRVLELREAGDLVGFSAGPAAKVIIYELYKHIGGTHTMIDFGSLWDGFCGVCSRKYMRDPRWKAMIPENLG